MPVISSYAKVAFFSVVVFCLILAFFSSYFAPGFSEGNLVAGILFWSDHDPGAWYLQSAHEILRKPTVYFGHPGLPMQLGNALVQKIVYFIYHGEHESYAACVIRKLYLVQVLSRTLITCMWIATAWMVKSVTLKLFRNKDTGYIAGILFLTSFPVIYYINRISPEPYMMFFFLLSFYCLMLVKEYCHAGDWKKTLFFSCAATFAAVSAFYSKIQLFGPLPVFIFISLIIFLLKPLSWPRLVGVLFLSMISLLLTAICFEPFMDWLSFAREWPPIARQWPPTAPWRVGQNIAGPKDILFAGLNVISQFVSVLSKITFHNILPFTDKSRLVFATEYGLILAYLSSFFYRVIRKNNFLIAMNIYIIFPTYVFLYRGGGLTFDGFHYLFPLLAVCCIQAAYVINAITNAPLNIPNWKTTMGSLFVVLIIHFTAVVFVVSAHQNRMVQGRMARQVYVALAELKPGECLPVKWQNSLTSIGITTGNNYNSGVSSLIENEILRRQNENK